MVQVKLDKLEYVERRFGKCEICQAPNFDCKRCCVENIRTKFSQAIVIL